MAGLAFNRILGGQEWIGVGYRSPESGQNELTAYFTSTADNTWETAYTVPAGKTLYVTDFLISCDGAADKKIGTGAGNFLIIRKSDSESHHISFRLVPLKFATGETIKYHGHASIGHSTITIVGWLE